MSVLFSVNEAGRSPVRRDTMGKRFGKLAARLGHSYTLHGLRHGDPAWSSGLRLDRA